VDDRRSLAQWIDLERAGFACLGGEIKLDQWQFDV
jgi:hypothetical protein